ncbi:Mov34/MPN/PAD-1 family protein [Sediminibacillus albus]|uniref:Proteasome lid subunit RPN8/RPN11, contains Jab1/MPN metalloenzyme (JAMM) motif n=1 Tax=Sediminibacillus albus TaxID=407036 RepID=A0A1G9AMK7_9BACI|nr:Mov34/MPN/PAD-1 family protein [Sediminibacillus albus]SDK28473.1 Proteasome lid subunit RPN8/RPN11, contains Jab1/MPN metalloenzyme (JAMM) motif [Sediminibacillus albus]
MGRKTDAIYLPKYIEEKMILHTREALPFDTCGLLSGTNNVVDSIWELESEIQHRFRYFVDKKTVEKTVAAISAKNEEVLIIYLSHPTAAPAPSRTDVLYHPDSHVPMLIVSLKDAIPAWKCYSLENNNYFSHQVVVL